MGQQARKRSTSCPNLSWTMTSDPSHEHLVQSRAKKKKKPSGHFSVLMLFDLLAAFNDEPVPLSSFFIWLLEHGPAWFSGFHPTHWLFFPIASVGSSSFSSPSTMEHSSTLSSTLTSCVISRWVEVLLCRLSSLYLGQWFSPGGTVLTTFGNGWRHSWLLQTGRLCGWGQCCWHLEGGGQGCGSACSSAQMTPTAERPSSGCQ